MAELPVPATMYFNDFKFDQVSFCVKRNMQAVGDYMGLYNSENGKRYIHFMHGSDIQVDDILESSDDAHIVKKVSVDTYMGKPELFKVYY